MAKIQKTTSAEREAISRRSVLQLADRPSEYGQKPSDVKNAIAMPVFGSIHSVLAELDRVVDEINAALEGTSDPAPTLATLSQTLIGAINELRAKLTSQQSGYATLQTVAQTVIEAINEVRAWLSNVSTIVDNATADAYANTLVMRDGDDGSFRAAYPPSDDDEYAVTNVGYVYQKISIALDTARAEIQDLNGTLTVKINKVKSDLEDADTLLNADISELFGEMQYKADLVSGKVPAAQLPAFVDDVLEYNSVADFPNTGESGKIYISLDTNKTYRWSGSQYAEISESLALGETADTAYAGNKGKANAQAIALLQAQIQDCADRTASELEFMGDVQIDGALTNSDGDEYLNTADFATQSEMAEILAVLS